MDEFGDSTRDGHWGIFAYQILAIPPREYQKQGVPPKLIAHGDVMARDDEEARVLALLEPHPDFEHDPDEKDPDARRQFYLNANEAYARLAVPMLSKDSSARIAGLFEAPRARIHVQVARKG